MALVSVINFLKEVDELKEAKNLLNTFAKYSNSLEQYDTLGMLYEKVKAYPESLKMLEKCLVLAKSPEQFHSIRANLAKVYNHVNEPEKSLFYSELNIQMNSNDYEALMEQSFSQYLWGNFEKSYEIQKRLMEDSLVPDNVKERITFNMGSFEMAQGNFKSGIFKMIVGGKEIGIWKGIKRSYPKWQGEQTDKTLLIFAEAGIGDEIVNIRFLKHLSDRGIKAKWVGHRKDLVSLFKSNGFDSILEKEIDPFEEYVYCESMSLPVLLDVDLNDLWYGPYLTPKQEYIDKWKAKLPENFITMKWSGNPYYEQDLHRSLDVDLLLSKLPKDMPIVSLQLDDTKEGLIKVDIESWEDTLAIQQLALLNITSCTSTAHSASASGAKCVVLPPIATYYPWLNLREDDSSYWYSENTKAYPQKIWRNWEPTIDKCIEHLNTLL